jgi:thermitase
MHVLGTLAAQAKAGVGVQGVASQGATVKLVNILGAAEVLPTNRVVRGLTWCEKQLDAAHKQQPGMRMVVSMSVGASNDTLLLKAILDKLAGRGDVLLVAAAGNTGDTTLQYPAGHPGVISVSAVTEFDSRCVMCACGIARNDV